MGSSGTHNAHTASLGRFCGCCGVSFKIICREPQSCIVNDGFGAGLGQSNVETRHQINIVPQASVFIVQYQYRNGESVKSTKACKIC